MKQRGSASRSVATPDVKGANPRTGGSVKGATKTGSSGGRKREDGGGEWFSGWGGGWVWYGVLVLLRGWGAVGPWGWWSGYVHPDEFFQSPEVAAGAVLRHAQLATPWEFHPSFACRSISLPLLVSGIPFAALEYLNRVLPPLVPDQANNPEGTLLSGFALLVAPRFAVFLLSLIVDLSALKIARVWDLSASHTLSILLTLASSWVMLLFHTRTFSNTIESIIFAFSAFVVLRAMAPQEKKGRGLLWDAVLGMTLAAGVFTRFTYLFFFMPVGLAYLLFHSRSGLWPAHRKGPSLVGRAVAMLGRLCVMLAGFLALSFLLAVLDSLYFGTLALSLHGSVVPWHGLMAVLSRPAEWAHVAFAGTLTLTPWNSLRYNMQVDNLKEHGIHPHYTHALVNFPLLYGPLALAAGAGGLRFVWSLLARAQVQPTATTDSAATLRRRGRWVLALSIVSGLGILSLAPHQEPRFLVPLVLPLSVLFPLFGGDEEQQQKQRKQTQTTKRRSGSGSLAKCLRPWSWVAFNVALLLFFGYLHQAGVVPSLLSLSSAAPQADGRVTHVVYFSTYMPPRYLLANRTDLIVHDVGGDATKLVAVLDLLAQDPHVYAVVPASVDTALHLPHFTSQVRFWPNLSTEDLPRSFAELDLVLFRRRLSQKDRNLELLLE